VVDWWGGYFQRTLPPMSTPNLCDKRLITIFGAVQAMPAAECCANSLAWFPYVM
jgi:hypothetical protein